MAETSINTNTAYGDESTRMVGNPPFYMLGASMLAAESVPELESIYKSLPGGPRKLHWRDMSRRRQRDSLGALSEIERVDVVVIASPLIGRKQERARRKCLQVLLPALEARGVEHLVLESRRAESDRRDLDYVEYAKGSHFVDSIRVEHKFGADEPRLWVADLVLGAMGDYLTRTGDWEYWEAEWKALSGRVERINVNM